MSILLGIYINPKKYNNLKRQRFKTYITDENALLETIQLFIVSSYSGRSSIEPPIDLLGWLLGPICAYSLAY